MEDKIMSNKSWWDNLDEVLEGMSNVYATDDKLFYKIFPKLKEFKYIRILATTGFVEGMFDHVEDTAEFAKEVYGYYTSYKANLKPDPTRVFTLRNADDLELFEEFLDKMLYLLELSPRHFVELFPKCPSIFWDKIDDLRETSFKYDRDSDEYTRCLRKCKDLSFQFSELSGTNTSNYE